jgi:hypothetical protein
MTLSFKYKSVKRPDGTEVKTPSIPVILKWKQQLDTIALLDSGADISAMPSAIAEILGCDLSGKKSSAFGIGGKVDAVDTKVSVFVGKAHECYEFQIPVKVIFGDYEFPILLGRAGFFENFIISFDQANGKVSLKKIGRR